eukprot:m.514826 g.514826  ORF g.514826 m.514826 type:complete len:282 (-) comp57457_c0_seq3:308-1153(-)
MALPRSPLAPPVDDEGFQHMLAVQLELVPASTFLEHLAASHISADSHRLLACWMLEACTDFEGCDLDMFASAISYFNRFLERQAVKRSKLQLVALACLLTASKMSGLQTSHVLVEDLLSFAEGRFTADDIRAQEYQLLQTLEWRLQPCQPNQYAEQFLYRLPGLNEDERARVFTGCSALIDISYTSSSLSSLGPAVVAAASLIRVLQIFVQQQTIVLLESDQENYFGLATFFAPDQQGSLRDGLAQLTELFGRYQKEVALSSAKPELASPTTVATAASIDM